MPTSNTPITLTTSSYVLNPSTETIITTTPAVTNRYTAGVVQNFNNAGTLEDSSTAGANDSAGIYLTVGDVVGGKSSIGNHGLITGNDFGISVHAETAATNLIGVYNYGTIAGTATSTAASGGGVINAAGVYFGGGVTGKVTNSGLIEGAEGVWLLVNTTGTETVSNLVGGRIEGTINEGGQFYGIKIQDNNGALKGTGNIYNAGYVKGIIDDAVKYSNVTNASTGTIIGGIFELGTGTLSLLAGESLTGSVTFLDGTTGLTLAPSTLVLNGTTTTVGELTDPSNFSGFGGVTITKGATWVIGTTSSSAGISGVTQISDFGTIDLAGGLTGNTINMEGSVAGLATEVDFTGSNTSTPITDYGEGDQIVFASLAGGPGTTYLDTYNTATGVLTVEELNAAGSIVNTATATVSGVPGGPSLNSSDFVDINGPNGETIVLGDSSLASQGSIYLDYGDKAILTNSGTADTIPVTFGTHASPLGVFNTLDIDGSVAGTNSPYTGAITGFGLNDDILLGPSVLPSFIAGDAVSLAYSGSLLTATEFNAAGTSIGSTTLDVGTGYNANSFVALIGTDGVNIETPQTVEEQGFTFHATNITGNFEDPTQYTGGLAPGSNIVAGETVTVVPTSLADLTTSLTNNGEILLDGNNANLETNDPLSGTGVVSITGGAVLNLGNTAGVSTNEISFGTAGILSLTGAGTTSFGGTIAGMGGNDLIDIGGSVLPIPTSASNISLSFSGGILTINDTVGGVDHVETLAFSGTVPGTFSASVTGGVIQISDVPCFAAGTRILTPDGEVAVEQLAVGDEVLTVRDGAARKIVWAGRRTIDLARHAMPEKVIPVIIRAGAFGPGLPERDLTLSPDHALYIDGHLIEAKTLVNGATIIRDRAARFVTYHHIELDRHDVVLAEGLAAETYLDSGNRGNFESAAAPLVLHPDFTAACRDAACAPLLLDGGIVRAARQRLLDRAFALGFAQTSKIDLLAKAGAARIAAQPGAAPDELFFVLPAGTDSVELLSGAGVPAEISADPTDRRVLGAAVTGLALIAGGARQAIDLEDAAHEGFHAAEDGHRWTTGHARITLPAHSGRAILVVKLNGQSTRWQAPAERREQAS